MRACHQAGRFRISRIRSSDTTTKTHTNADEVKENRTGTEEKMSAAIPTASSSSSQHQQRQWSSLPSLSPSLLRFLFFLLLLLQSSSNNNKNSYIQDGEDGTGSSSGISFAYGLPTGFRDEGIVLKAGASAFNFVPKTKTGDHVFDIETW